MLVPPHPPGSNQGGVVRLLLQKINNIKETTMAHLTLQQRYKIERMLQQGASRHQIAAEIGVDHSTVSREIKKT